MSKFINLHVIQSVPVNCMNRDDVGNIKTAIFGGVTRARVSSQCWKRNIREVLQEKISEIAYRSDRFPDYIFQKLVGKGMNPELAFNSIVKVFGEMISKKATEMFKSEEIKTEGAIEEKNNEEVVEENGKKKKGKKEKVNKRYIFKQENYNPEEFRTDTLLFFSEMEIDHIVDQILSSNENLSNIVEIISNAKDEESDKMGVQVALFGRMVAKADNLNVEASSSYAHAITTHEISMETDYFTALDDLKTSQGAGHLNVSSFTSGVFYRHMVLNVDTLKKNLKVLSDEKLIELIEKWIVSCVEAFPKGKQTSFESRTLPSYILVEVVENPLSLANAFEVPVSENGGHVNESINVLKEHRNTLYETFGIKVLNSIEIPNAKISDLKDFVSKSL